MHPYLSGIPANLDEDVERIVALFPRLHCLVVGPGLSRDPEMLTVAKEVIVRAVEHEKLLVIDAVCFLDWIVQVWAECLLANSIGRTVSYFSTPGNHSRLLKGHPHAKQGRIR